MNVANDGGEPAGWASPEPSRVDPGPGYPQWAPVQPQPPAQPAGSPVQQPFAYPQPAGSPVQQPPPVPPPPVPQPLQPPVPVRQPVGYGYPAAGPYGPAPAQAGLGVGYPFGPPPTSTVAILRNGQPLPAAARVDPIEGTPYGVAFLRGPTTTSGAAVGSLVVGIISILVSFVVGCIGLATPGGIIASGAFAILAAALGLGAVGLGLVGRRQAGPGGSRTGGRGVAMAGIACGGTGILLTVLAVVAALVTDVGA